MPRRPRQVVDAHHAGRVLQLAPTYRDVLPRWGINSPIRSPEPEPGAYAGTIAWTSREHYLRVIVPAAIAARRDVLSKHHVGPDLLTRWAAAKSLYAQEASSGREVIVTPKTLAGLMQCDTRTVKRLNAAAREMGLEVVRLTGRMLSEIEVYKARKAGSPQRGLSTVSAFVVPAYLRGLVDYATPTRGEAFRSPVADILTLKQRSARSKGAPLRSAPHQQEESGEQSTRNSSPQSQKRPSEPRTPPSRPQGPSWHLAAALTQQVIFLHRCPPGRIARQLQRFTDPQRTHGLHWTSNRLTRAMDQINVRLGYVAPVKAKTAPWALLAWYLGQIDPYADHPDAGPHTS